MKENAVIFDLDGTLWNSTKEVSEIWNSVFEKEEIPLITVDTVKQCMGKTNEEISRILFQGLPEQEQKRIMDLCADAEVEYFYQNGAVLYEGVKETLWKLKKNYDLYIVSNCQDGYVQAFLHAHELEDCFDDIEISGRTGKSKEENIALVIQRNHIENAVYVGDTNGDLNAAKEAGIPFIYAEYGFGNIEKEKYRISCFSKLKEILPEVFMD